MFLLDTSALSALLNRDHSLHAKATGVRHLGPQNGGFCRVAFIWIKGLHAISGARL